MIDYTGLPEHMREACGRADDINQHRLFDIVSWLYMNAPAPCWGSPDKVQRWINPENPK